MYFLMSGWKKLLLLGCCLVALFAPARGQDPVLLTTGVNYPPITGADLPNGGIFTDIVTQIFTEMGEDVSLRRLPWKRAFLQADNGDVLGTFPWESRPDLEDRFHFSDPVIYLSHYIYVDSENGPNIAKAEDLSGLRYCLPLGYRAHGLAADYKGSGSLRVEQPVSMKNCFDMLKLGRVDFVSLSAMAAQQHARLSYGYADGVRKAPVGAVSVRLHLLISHKIPEGQNFLERFNRILGEFRHSRRLEQIIMPHLWVP